MKLITKLRVLFLGASLTAITCLPALQAVSGAQNQANLPLESKASPNALVIPAPSPRPADGQTPTLGPDQFPAGVNPLTGLPVDDPALLSLPPALISVANFPVSARPQAGLSFAPYVFEMFIGEGMTRFLALFYGDFPQEPISSTAQAGSPSDQAAIGPIRSGRLPYQDLRSLYNGFLVMASASSEVQSQLPSVSNIFGSDNDDINSALINVNKLQAIAQANANGKVRNLTGNLYSDEVPAGGADANRLWVFYSFLNQVLWTYDPASQAYLRQQDQADGSGKFYPSSDRLTGEQLAFENVVVLFAKHKTLNSAKTLIDLDLHFTQDKAYLFRNGMVYPIFWTTSNGDYEKQTGQFRPLRFVDADGNPFPLQPGQTWIEIVDVTATLTEKEPGYWKARFYAP